MFDEKWCTESYIDSDANLRPSFIAELSMIDFQHIKTLFFTKRVNQEGYYQYFLLRDGEYHVDYVDDWIPVVGKNQTPIWGLSIKEPWKLVLLKAWLKEKGSIKEVLNAEPFEFMNYFGLLGYRALSIVKEVHFLNVSKISESAKEAR